MKFRTLWLILEQSGADVCAKDPGFEVNLIVRGKIADLFISVTLVGAIWKGRQ